jgi:sterol desaturase/sphingolipid hydroxylase (fatty acid hydroxylase superfamily)
MDWTSTRLSYYADWVLVPLLMFLAAWLEVHTNGPSDALIASTLLGYAIWTFAEYWIHRSLFHVVMRRAHWLHHMRPRGWVSAPAWVTAFAHVLLWGALAGSAGPAAGTGLFLGIEAGYLGYIVVHDRIHHGPRRFAYIRRRAALHDIHHTYGSEQNFGVVSSFWDHVFQTHFSPQSDLTAVISFD